MATTATYGDIRDKSPISIEYPDDPNFPYDFTFLFADERGSRHSETASYDETDKSPASREYETVADKSKVSSEYGSVVNRSGLDDEYDTTPIRYGYPSSY